MRSCQVLSLFAGVLTLAPVASADVLSQAQDLGVAHLSLQALAPVETPDGLTTLTVDLDGRVAVLELEPRSTRSDAFTVVLDRGNGVMEEITPPPSRAFRGVIAGEPDSIVAGSIIDGLAKLMVFSGDDVWTVQPVDGEGPGVHAVFEDDAIIDHGNSCGTPDAPAFRPADEPRVHHMASGFANRGSNEFRVAEIAIEADYQLYNNFFNRNETNLLNDIDNVLAGVSAIYERDVALTYELTHVLIRTTNGSNPYTTNDPGQLLGQFQDEWNANQTDIQRDVAHLWTGRNMTGSVIGIAYLSVICTPSAYGANQILFSNNYNSRVALFAHELGHNWAAEHCNDDSECRIMCSGLGGCNGLGNPVRFAPGPISQILAHIASRTCVDGISVGLPFSESLAGATLTPGLWGSNFGFSIINDGGAPTNGRAGRFDPEFNVLSTVPIQLDAASGNGVGVRFWVRPEGPTPKPFRVSARAPGSSEIFVSGLISIDGAPGYQEQNLYLPASLLGGEAIVSFLAPVNEPAWRIDDITITEVSQSNASASIPFTENFEQGGVFLDAWQPSALSVIADTGSAPSGLYIARLEPGGVARTVDLNAQGASDIVFGVLASAPADAGPGDELVLSFRDGAGDWIEAGRFPASAFPGDGYSLAEVVLPAAGAHADLSVSIEASGPAASPWRLDDIEVGGESRASDCPADLAPPAGVLDLADINAFTAGFIASDPVSDLAAPFGVWDLADVNAFVASFIAGCP
jgi:hypothetical protein